MAAWAIVVVQVITGVARVTAAEREGRATGAARVTAIVPAVQTVLEAGTFREAAAETKTPLAEAIVDTTDLAPRPAATVALQAWGLVAAVEAVVVVALAGAVVDGAGRHGLGIKERRDEKICK